ncbi:hypothetical protein DPMN_165074 [Dreissena polymorpha]|uniref:Uncharacterized protein n=1 Tax=Dreissena polymorpha TaxID=45954 RepID=A0A9D4EYY8_DREPO|nr:hypothetical protein DPMN_165074 [Dreissena polymorpha]
MDETPMFFDMPGSNTVNPIGEKTISIRTKLPPAVVFKRSFLLGSTCTSRRKDGWTIEL